MTRIEQLEAALRGVRQELWVDHCLYAGRTDVDPSTFNSKPHIRIIDAALDLKVLLPCPVCGGEAIHAIDVLKRTVIQPARQENDDVFKGFRGNNEA